MDILKMLGELRQQRDRLEEAIIVIERLAAHGGKRRGRPPKWMQKVKAEVVGGAGVQRKRKAFSAETRAKMAKSQRDRWARSRG